MNEGHSEVVKLISRSDKHGRDHSTSLLINLVRVFFNYLSILCSAMRYLSFSYSLGSFSISTLYFFTFCSVDLFGLAIEFSSYFFSKQLDRMNLENQLHILQERTNKEGVNSIVQKLVLLMMPL